MAASLFASLVEADRFALVQASVRTANYQRFKLQTTVCLNLVPSLAYCSGALLSLSTASAKCRSESLFRTRRRKRTILKLICVIKTKEKYSINLLYSLSLLASTWPDLPEPIKPSALCGRAQFERILESLPKFT